MDRFDMISAYRQRNQLAEVIHQII